MKVHANGIDIHYRIAGSGPWLTLSHSLCTDLSMWDAQMAALTPHFRVLRYDTRGHGQSGAPQGADEAYTWEQLSGDALALFDALGIAQTHFVGLSMGGMIGQHLVLRAPQRVSRLVLADTACRYPASAAGIWQERIRLVRAEGLESQLESTLARWFTAPFRAGNPSVMAHIATLIRSTPTAGYIGCGKAIATLDLMARLAEISCPTLVMVGAEDGGTPPAMAREIAQAIPGARLEIIPDAAHLANIEQAGVFNQLLLAFLLND